MLARSQEGTRGGVAGAGTGWAGMELESEIEPGAAGRDRG